MNKNTKILIICVMVVLSVITIIFVMSRNHKYTDDYNSIDLYNAVSDSFYTEGGIDILDEDIILEFSDEKPPFIKDYTVIKAKTAKNINEIGIFRVEKGKMKEAKLLVAKYVLQLQKSYRAMDYFPEEVEKIDNATVQIYGNYVIYSFLNEKDTEALYNSVEKALKD